jgi:hypothetical protein
LHHSQAIEDKTFGMKNKKGAKGQQKIQQVKQSMEATAARAQGCAPTSSCKLYMCTLQEAFLHHPVGSTF